MSKGAPGFVEEASCGWEEAVLMAGGFGPDGPQPPARDECLREFLLGLRKGFNDLSEDSEKKVFMTKASICSDKLFHIWSLSIRRPFKSNICT